MLKRLLKVVPDVMSSPQLTFHRFQLPDDGRNGLWLGVAYRRGIGRPGPLADATVRRAAVGGFDLDLLAAHWETCRPDYRGDFKRLVTKEDMMNRG